MVAEVSVALVILFGDKPCRPGILVVAYRPPLRAIRKAPPGLRAISDPAVARALSADMVL